MNNNYSNNEVNCSMDQPLQVFIDKLSCKSSELYIFWQNYNQLYNLYQQKTNQIIRLRQQIVTIRRQTHQLPKVQVVDDNFLKQRYLNLQKKYDDLKLQNQRIKNQTRVTVNQTKRYYQQNLQLQTLLQQLREQNNIQRQSIEKILNQLKNAQNQLSTYSKLYDQVQQKDFHIAKFIQNQKRLNEIILQRQQEIEELIVSQKQTNINYQNLIRQSMNNAKTKVIESLPNLIRTSKQKVQVIAG